MFYQDDRIDEMDEADQDMQLLNDEANDLLMQQDMEDDVAIAHGSKQPGSQYAKKSPNTMTSSTRKGANLANISNTVHGNNRQGATQSQLMRQQPSGENKHPTGAPSAQQQKRMVSHQNQFSNK